MTAPLPSTRNGSARPCRQRALVVGCLLPRPAPSGGVLLGVNPGNPGAPAAPGSATALPIHGDFEALAEVVADQAVDLVLVSLPPAMAEQARNLSRAAQALGVACRMMPTLEVSLDGPSTAAARIPKTAAPIARPDRRPCPLNEEPSTARSTAACS